MMKLLLLTILLFTLSCKEDKRKVDGDFNPYVGKDEILASKRSKYLFEYDGKRYDKHNLPRELRVYRYKYDMQRYLSFYNAMESYGVRKDFQIEKGTTDPRGQDDVASLPELFKDTVKDFVVDQEYKKREVELKSKNIPERLAKDSIRIRLLMEKITPTYMKRRETLYQSNKLKFGFLPPDIREIGIPFHAYPSLGSKEAKFELTVISNYHCPRCRAFNEKVKDLYKKYGKNLSLRHVNHVFYPETINFDSILAGHCINLLGKASYWKYHKMIYEDNNFAKLKRTERQNFKKILNQYISKLKLDKEKVYECISNKENLRYLSENIISFKNIGVKSLPLFYLNGRQLILLKDEELGSAFETMAKSLGLY